jgi:hypothetical protein
MERLPGLFGITPVSMTETAFTNGLNVIGDGVYDMAASLTYDSMTVTESACGIAGVPIVKVTATFWFT